MVEFKLNIGNPKTSKCVQQAIAEPATDAFIGLKIGDTIKGDSFDMAGYEFEITGGSDFCGFPMRKGVAGDRKKILAEKGVGFRKHAKGIKTRKTVCGETITKNTVQINLKVLKEGKKKLGEAPAEEAKEAPAKEAPKKEVKEAPKEEKKEEVKEAPKEEKKEEAPKK